MRALLLIVLAVISLGASLAYSDISTATPVFTWSVASGATEYRLRCDGSNTTVYWAKPAELTWTAPAGTFTPGSHSCFVIAIMAAAPNPQTNTVSFVIPPAVVVVPPVPKFALTVQ